MDTNVQVSTVSPSLMFSSCLWVFVSSHLKGTEVSQVRFPCHRSGPAFTLDSSWQILWGPLTFRSSGKARRQGGAITAQVPLFRVLVEGKAVAAFISSTLEMVDGQFLPLHNPQQTLWSVLTSDHRCLTCDLIASLAYLPSNSPQWEPGYCLGQEVFKWFWQFKSKCNGNEKEVLGGGWM